MDIFLSDSYGIFLHANAKLSYDVTPSYMLLIKCSTENQVGTSTLTINLIRNMPPFVQNLPGK